MKFTKLKLHLFRNRDPYHEQFQYFKNEQGYSLKKPQLPAQMIYPVYNTLHCIIYQVNTKDINLQRRKQRHCKLFKHQCKQTFKISHHTVKFEVDFCLGFFLSVQNTCICMLPSANGMESEKHTAMCFVDWEMSLGLLLPMLVLSLLPKILILFNL